MPKGVDLENFIKTFYEKRKNWLFWEFLYITHKSYIKTFLKLSMNKCPKGTMDP